MYGFEFQQPQTRYHRICNCVADERIGEGVPMPVSWIGTIFIALIVILFGGCAFIPSDGVTNAPVTTVSVVAASVLEQHGRWVEIDAPEGYEPDVLEFRDGTVTLTQTYETTSEITGPMTYTLGDDGVIDVDQTGMGFCEFLELQEVEIDGQTVPIVSQYLFEYDGRGAIIVTEYAPEEFVDLFPAGYQSERMQETRARDGSSMAMNW